VRVVSGLCKAVVFAKGRGVLRNPGRGAGKELLVGVQSDLNGQETDAALMLGHLDAVECQIRGLACKSAWIVKCSNARGPQWQAISDDGSDVLVTAGLIVNLEVV
jgi:hypothetical protein